MNQQQREQTQTPSQSKDDLSELDKLLHRLPDVVQTKMKLNEIFNSIHLKLNQGQSYENILDSIFNSLDPLIPFVRIGIALLENNNQDIRLYWVKSKLPIKALHKGYVAKLADSSLKKIFITGEPRIINDLRAYLRLHPESKSTELALQDGIRSNLTCPLIIGNKRLGFIFFSSVNSYTYEKAHQELYKELARGLSMIIEHEFFMTKH